MLDPLSYATRGIARMSVTSLATRGVIAEHIFAYIKGTTPMWDYYRVQNLTGVGWFNYFIPNGSVMDLWEFDWYDDGAITGSLTLEGFGISAAAEWSTTMNVTGGGSFVRSIGWHRVKFTYADGVAKLYYDGELLGSRAYSGTYNDVRMYFVGGGFCFKNMTYAINGGAISGPYFINSTSPSPKFLSGYANGLNTKTNIYKYVDRVVDAIYNGHRIPSWQTNALSNDGTLP